MQKLFILLCSICFIACNNQSSAPEKSGNQKNASSTPVNNLPHETEMEIISECVDNAKANAGNKLDTASAYALCRCVLRQVQEKYPSADSAALVGHLNDTAQVTQMVQKCQ